MRVCDLVIPDRRPEGVVNLLDKHGQRLQLVYLGEAARPASRSSSSPPLSLFREANTGLLRVAHRELVLRFAHWVPEARRRAILADGRCSIRRVNPFVPDQAVVFQPAGKSPGCRILPVKIFRGDELACDEGVANAIRYAALHADVLSCSWRGGFGPDVRQALEDAGTLGRRGLGATVFCSAGNGQGAPVAFPANDPGTVAVGASTDLGTSAEYSNCGPELSVVAPSSGGNRRIFTTDLSQPGRGFSPGDLHTDQFGGTSAATAITAGVAALVLSVHPGLDRWELKELLEETAEKIGGGYNALGHSLKMGYGRVDAGRAVEEAARRVSAPLAYSETAYSATPLSCSHPPRSS